MSGIVRNVEPTCLKDLWSRKNALRQSIDMTRTRIKKFQASIIENERHLADVVNELEIIERGIQIMEGQCNGK